MATNFISERLSVFGSIPLVAICSINDICRICIGRCSGWHRQSLLGVMYQALIVRGYPCMLFKQGFSLGQLCVKLGSASPLFRWRAVKRISQFYVQMRFLCSKNSSTSEKHCHARRSVSLRRQVSLVVILRAQIRMKNNTVSE
ncbi:hypothetical protein PILCRDRAFT_308274 [Piloderma croceum F 1598]|uniref:Uncharacterized protein n=1 Tax=Piloderma croceum (strain F 1598) TaxID=765440 RepID=A0A0C3CA29_PILCF|nr:hypothetical protein PILCRDRAFT_308274 [Piloderma croceum F 1598]